jgi:hypothetical protein
MPGVTNHPAGGTPRRPLPDRPKEERMKSDPKALRELADQISDLADPLQKVYHTFINEHFEAAEEDAEALFAKCKGDKSMTRDAWDSITFLVEQMTAIRHSLRMYSDCDGETGLELIGLCGYAAAMRTLADLLDPQPQPVRG